MLKTLFSYQLVFIGALLMHISLDQYHVFILISYLLFIVFHLVSTSLAILFAKKLKHLKIFGLITFVRLLLVGGLLWFGSAYADLETKQRILAALVPYFFGLLGDTSLMYSLAKQNTGE